MATSKASPAHIEVAPRELANIAGIIIIVGDHDEHVRVTGSVEPSATYRGMFVETEVGSLYLSEDLPVTIVNPELPEDTGMGALAHAIGLLGAS
ncbi:hypothetical protein A0W34_13640 [Rhodococcus sp. BH4]|uniref:hypothetical protein n=1 Tax=Rhodococcus sp. BH4 TaxID=1807790 RepID=UPI0009C1B416|nr:hypothetical protein [Rhodococcus sp. BH4]ARE34230.1 hypothetical protein A0W34_13640 [Rhodococcus sp. BH4]